MSAPLCDNFEIPFHDIGPQERTPRLALVAGPYNELNGLFVLVRLADFLNQIYSGQRAGQHLRERVIIIPAINLAGASIRSPDRLSNKSDSNAMSPDNKTDDITQCIAVAVLKATRQAYYRVDIHASNLGEEVPQVRLYEPTDDERASACLFGLPAIIEQPINTVLSTHWIRSWRQYGGENFVIQGGQAGSLQTIHCEVLFRALVAFLDRTGIVDGLILSKEEENLRYFGIHQTFAVLSEHSGIFVSRLEVGRWVQAGECLGFIYHGFTGELRTEINAPVSGLVSTLRRQPLLCEGDFVARILTTEQSTG